MKATIKYRDVYGQRKQKTIKVERNEPNSIIREFVYQLDLAWAYVTTIKCGRIEYQWYGTVKDAF